MEASGPLAHNSFWCQINGFNDVYADWHAGIYVHLCIIYLCNIEAGYNPVVCVWEQCSYVLANKSAT